MLRIIEFLGYRLKNRDSDGFSGGVRFVATMDGNRFFLHDFLLLLIREAVYTSERSPSQLGQLLGIRW